MFGEREGWGWCETGVEFPDYYSVDSVDPGVAEGVVMCTLETMAGTWEGFFVCRLNISYHYTTSPSHLS